jgi:hypothetical protein
VGVSGVEIMDDFFEMLIWAVPVMALAAIGYWIWITYLM